jgi:WXG100 family type VII secretion target
MSVDIRVDPDILEDFANALAQFQDTLEGELQSLNSEWSRCSETFIGKQKDEFAANFDTTCQSITQAVEVGRNAADQLKRYQDAVKQALD